MGGAGTEALPPAFPHVAGRDCATSSFRNLLHGAGVVLSEGMVFGLGEGLSFWYAERPDSPFPVLLGQNLALEEDLCNRLGIGMRLHEPAIPEEAEHAFDRVRAGVPTVMKADTYYMEYCWEDDPQGPRWHFGEHELLVVSIVGEGDESIAWVSDIMRDALAPVPLEQLRAARASVEGEPYLLARNRWYELTFPEEVAWQEAIRPAAEAAMRRLLEAKGRFGIAGMRAAAERLPDWAAAAPPELLPEALKVMRLRMDDGAAGSCFRRFHTEFLEEAAELLDDGLLRAVGQGYRDAVLPAWRSVVETLGEVMSAPDRALELAGAAAASIGRAAELETRLCRAMINGHAELQ